MHPLNNSNFGQATGQINISFHNGTSVVAGWIVNQVGTTRFNVTNDGTTIYTVLLADSTSLAASLTAGYGTILVVPPGGGSNQHAMKIYDAGVITTEGNSYPWSLAGQTSFFAGLDARIALPITVAATASVIHNTPKAIDFTSFITNTFIH